MKLLILPARLRKKLGMVENDPVDESSQRFTAFKVSVSPQSNRKLGIFYKWNRDLPTIEPRIKILCKPGANTPRLKGYFKTGDY